MAFVEQVLVSLFPKRFFGQIKTGKNGVLVSEYLSDITFENYQPFVVNASQCLSGFSMTMFTKTDSATYIRTATTIKDQNDQYAVGTPLDPASAAYAKLQQGLPYQGEAVIFGKRYQTTYIPIFEPPAVSGAGAVIGAFFIGYALFSSLQVAPLDVSRANVKLIKYLTGPCHACQVGTLQPERVYSVSSNQGYLRDPNNTPEVPKTNFTNAMFQNVFVNLNRPLSSSNTLFVRLDTYDASLNVTDSNFIRCATTLLKEDGSFATNTPLLKTSPAYQLLLQGKSYEGIVPLFGYNYYAVYEPILDEFTGFVIGAYFAGYFV